MKKPNEKLEPKAEERREAKLPRTKRAVLERREVKRAPRGKA